MTLDTDAIAARLTEGLDLYFCDDCDYVGPGVLHTNPTHRCHHVGYSLGAGREISERARDVLATWLALGDIAALLAEVATLRALLNRAEPLIRDEWDGTRPESEGNVWLADYVRVSRLTEEPQQ